MTRTGTLSTIALFTGLATPEGAMGEAATEALANAGTTLEYISASSGTVATGLDCAKAQDAACGLEVAGTALAVGSTGAVLKAETRAEAATDPEERELLEVKAKYLDAGKSNLEFGLSVGSFANSAADLFASQEQDPREQLPADRLARRGKYVTWQ